MSALTEVFNNKKAFVAYVTAGDNSLAVTLQAMLALVKGGVDIIEVGVPFSDPIADGPVIAQAMQRALANQVTLAQVLDLIKQFKSQTATPVVLFSYFNPILAALSQDENFFHQAKAAGVDGILIVDLPLEEAADYRQKVLAAGLDPIFIVSVASDSQRISNTNAHAQGFIYYACRKGTTGVRSQLPEHFAEEVQMLKQQVNYPVVAGFGISQRDVVAEVLKVADGFVVGSLFVKAIAEGATPEQLTQLAQAIDARTTPV